MIETPTPPTPEPAPTPPPEPPPEEDARIPRERLNQESAKRKAAEKELAEARRQLEERENAGLPELERERKAREKLERDLQEEREARTKAEQQVQRTARERWVIAAAQAQNFADPSDAAVFVNLDEIEDERDAERAVKRLAGTKKHLLKAEEPKLPGRVLRDGQRETSERKTTGIDPLADAQVLADGLRQFASKQ